MPIIPYLVILTVLGLLLGGIIMFPSIRLQIDYLKCEMIIKKSSKSFYQAFSVIKDKEKRKGIYAVYAFCRQVDDAVDIQKSSLILTNLENQLIEFSAHNQAHYFIFRALKDTSKRFYPSGYDFKPFFDMIEGQKMDLNSGVFHSIDELFHYCDLVASSVGHMLLPILSPNNYQNLGDFANNLGRAMQITNILRDVGEDLLLGRVYLPTELMEKYSFVPKTNITNKNQKAFLFVFEELAKVAENYYQLCESKMELFPFDARLPLHASLRLYKAILGACRENDYNVFNKRNFVSAIERKKIVDELKKNYGV